MNKVVKGSSDGSTENSDSSTKSSGLTTLSCHPKPMAVSTVTSICLGAWNDTFHSYNCSYSNWMLELPTDWLETWSTDFYCLSWGNSQADYLTNWLIDFANLLAELLFDLLTHRMIHWLTDLFVELTDWLTDWLALLTYWLNDCLIYWLTEW